MIYKNIEVYNAAELVYNDDGSVSFDRVPSCVHRHMDAAHAYQTVNKANGVELRFVIKGESATIRMSAYDKSPETSAAFHVYYGGVQGRWSDHEVHRHVTGEVQNYVINRPANMDRLREMTKSCGYEFDPEVVRIIFDRARYKLYDVIGDVAPPAADQTPSKTLLAYGSSITYGANSIDMSHSWVSVIAHNLKMDARNLGMAGSCAIEPEFADYIATMGERGEWDIALLELGINVLDWNDEMINDRVENMLRNVAGRNPDKEVFVISPFYYCGEDFDNDKNPTRWRTILSEIVDRLNFANVTYINGLDVLDGMQYMSADEIHPNIYGVQRISDVLTERIRYRLNKKNQLMEGRYAEHN